jgi:hypothetical protein
MGFAKMAADVILELFLHLTKFCTGDNEVLSIRHLRKALNVVRNFQGHDKRHD